MRIAVLGAGAWGTALAIAFAARHQVILWARDAQRVADMARRRENQRYLPDCPFPADLLTADFRAALAAADRRSSRTAASLVPCRQLKADASLPFLWACKGLEAGNGLLPHRWWRSDGRCGLRRARTEFALEVARGLPTVPWRRAMPPLPRPPRSACTAVTCASM